MSIFSDYKYGGMDEDEYRQCCTEMNRADRIELEEMYAEEDEEDDE